jgi:hypothetical protein
MLRCGVPLPAPVNVTIRLRAALALYPSRGMPLGVALALMPDATTSWVKEQPWATKTTDRAHISANDISSFICIVGGAPVVSHGSAVRLDLA